MSETTSIYLRKKGLPLMKYRDVTEDETRGMSSEDYVRLQKELDEYNAGVTRSLGCLLFEMCTTPSRELEVLPFSPDPAVLSTGLLLDVLNFYDGKLTEVSVASQRLEKNLVELEERIRVSNENLYDRISRDISSVKEDIDACLDEYNRLSELNRSFLFAGHIIEREENADYELVYVKC